MSATDVGEGLLRRMTGGKAISVVPPTPKAAAASVTRATAVKGVRVGEEEVLLFFFAGDDTAAMADVLRGEAGRFSRIVATLPASLELLVNSCVGAVISSPPSPTSLPPLSIRWRIASLKGFALSGSGDGAGREGMVVLVDG